jgi:hypothetical protein
VVQNSGKALRTDAIKLNTPEPIRVKEDHSALPIMVKMASRLVGIKVVDDRWRLDDEWWRNDPVSRLYYAVLLVSGQRLVIYKDLIANCWYKQK